MYNNCQQKLLGSLFFHIQKTAWRPTFTIALHKIVHKYCEQVL